MKLEERIMITAMGRVLVFLLLLGASFQLFPQGVVAEGPPVDGQKTQEKSTGGLEKELAVLQEKLRRRSMEELERRKSQLSRLNQLRYESRNQERLNSAIQKQVSELEKKISESVGKSSAAIRETEQILTQENLLKERIRRFLDALKDRILGGIPWKISERVRTIDNAFELIQSEETSAQVAIATAGRMVKEQEALGRLVEFGIVEIEVDGETRGIQGFHFGLLGVVFSDAEGNVFGWAGPGQSLENGIAAGSSEASEGYLMAVDILNRRRTPGLVNLQIPSLQMKGDQ